jgi:hypothetical protein
VSAFLGPIHFIMYERIQLVAARAQFVRQFAEAKMAPSQKEEFASSLQNHWKLPADGPLEELIGDTPIHAWLQQSMEETIVAEAALFAALCDRPERISQIAGIMRDHGLRVGEALLTQDPEIAKNATRLLQLIDHTVLGSMPCDHVSDVIATSATSYIERRDLLFHSRLVEAGGTDLDTWLTLQEAWMMGLVSAVPGAKLVRAEVTVDGRRLFDDRLMLTPEA